MTDSANDLPNDIERLKAMLIAERATHAAERVRLVEQNDRLLHTLRQLQRNQFGRKSERLSEDQLNLGLEDLETAIASGEAAQEKADATLASCGTHPEMNPDPFSAKHLDRIEKNEEQQPLIPEDPAHEQNLLRGQRKLQRKPPERAAPAEIQK